MSQFAADRHCLFEFFLPRVGFDQVVVQSHQLTAFWSFGVGCLLDLVEELLGSGREGGGEADWGDGWL